MADETELRRQAASSGAHPSDSDGRERERDISDGSNDNDNGMPHQSEFDATKLSRKKNRVLSIVVHAVLFLTASAGLAISMVILVEERPWALDLEATERMLGLRRGNKISKILAAAGAQLSFDEWIKHVGGVEHNERVQLLVKMLYMTTGGICCLLCFVILAISFFAPQNRPLVFTCQVAICLGLSELARYLAYFYEDSRHAPTCGVLLVLNWGALLAQSLDFTLSNIWVKDRDKTKTS